MDFGEEQNRCQLTFFDSGSNDEVVGPKSKKGPKKDATAVSQYFWAPRRVKFLLFGPIATKQTGPRFPSLFNEHGKLSMLLIVSL